MTATITAKPTKKELNEALKPLFAQADRYALGRTTGGQPAPRHTPINWRGLVIDIQLVRRSQVLTGVPFPFAVFEFWYVAKRDGVRVVGGISGRPSFIDAVFNTLRRDAA
jgi:hypothetical protein